MPDRRQSGLGPAEYSSARPFSGGPSAGQRLSARRDRSLRRVGGDLAGDQRFRRQRHSGGRTGRMKSRGPSAQGDPRGLSVTVVSRWQHQRNARQRAGELKRKALVSSIAVGGSSMGWPILTRQRSIPKAGRCAGISDKAGGPGIAPPQSAGWAMAGFHHLVTATIGKACRALLHRSPADPNPATAR